MTHNPFSSMPDFYQTINQFWDQSKTLLPGLGNLAIPPISQDELSKRISDMKTVESWLKLNTLFLQNSIQALEMQHAMLATLEKNTPANKEKNNDTATSSPDTADTTTSDNHSTATNATTAEMTAMWWNMLQQQFEMITKAATENFSSTSTASSQPNTSTHPNTTPTTDNNRPRPTAAESCMATPNKKKNAQDQLSD